jgi:hypothetical protein
LIVTTGAICVGKFSSINQLNNTAQREPQFSTLESAVSFILQPVIAL